MSKHIISKRVYSHRAPQRYLRWANREHPSQMAAGVYLATRECYIVFMMCLINQKRIGPFTNCMALSSVPCPPEIRNSLRHNPVLRGLSTALPFLNPSIIFPWFCSNCITALRFFLFHLHFFRGFCGLSPWKPQNTRNMVSESLKEGISPTFITHTRTKNTPHKQLNIPLYLKQACEL